MAQLGITVSTQNGSRFSCTLFEEKVLAVDTHVCILAGYNEPDGKPATFTYANDHLNIHGTRADLLALAQQIMKVCDDPPEPECTCIRTGDIDDASQCEAHHG